MQSTYKQWTLYEINKFTVFTGTKNTKYINFLHCKTYSIHCTCAKSYSFITTITSKHCGSVSSMSFRMLKTHNWRSDVVIYRSPSFFFFFLLTWLLLLCSLSAHKKRFTSFDPPGLEVDAGRPTITADQSILRRLSNPMTNRWGFSVASHHVDNLAIG